MAGPLYHKLKDGTMEKCYVALFTCCVTRAVHLEITLDLSTEAFLRAFRRFTSGRGTLELVVSDNTKQFKKSNNVLKSTFKRKEVRTYFTQTRIVWLFNLEREPLGGAVFSKGLYKAQRDV